MLREHAREADEGRAQWLGELEDLKEALRDRVREVAQREAELQEAIRRLEHSRDGRSRRGRREREELRKREEALEERSRELDTRAEELEHRERELERRDRQASTRRRRSTS